MKGYRFVFFWMFLAALVVVGVETFWISTKRLSPFDRVVHLIFSPFQAFTRDTGEFASNLVHAGALRKERDDLESQVSLLKEQIRRLQSREEENKELKSLLRLKSEVARNTVAADVIERDPSSWFHLCMINRGTQDGVRSEAGVIATGGVVGKVLQVSATQASVLLLLDPSMAVPVEILPSGSQGIAYGNGERGCLVKYLARDAVINPGDAVITSGYGHIFQKGIPLGTVLSVDAEEQNLFKRATVAPSAHLGRMKSVLVFLP